VQFLFLLRHHVEVAKSVMASYIRRVLYDDKFMNTKYMYKYMYSRIHVLKIQHF